MQLKKSLQRTAGRLLSIGELPDESSNHRHGRQLLILGGVLMSGGGLLWGGLAFIFGQWAAAAVPLGYVLLTVVNLAAFARFKRFPVARTVQIAGSLLLPFLFQWTLGGFVSSGGVMLWAMLALVGSLSFTSARSSVVWLVLYCVLTVISGLADAWLASASNLNPSSTVVRLFFVINIVVISSIVFGLSLALTVRQRDAIAALELGEAKTRELANQLRTAIVARENDIARLQAAERALRDLTASLERQVQERTTELATALEVAKTGTRAKSEFLAVMSHEIRTPLNGILGTVELLSDSRLDEAQQTQVGVIRRSGELLLSIINDVLDFSKIEAGKIELEHQPFDVQAAIETVAALHRPLANERSVALEVDCSGVRHRSISGDPHRLAQVLGNLLANAVKFTPAGTIRVHATTQLENDEVRVDVSVTDTGIGMGPEVLGRLFNPFSQADSSITRRYGGTGLGLAICARLVERMRGAIAVNSTPGEGTTFSFHILAPEAREVAQLTRAPLSTTKVAGLKVLLAEDNHVNQTIGAELLRRVGCTVVVCSNGVEALACLRAERFDLVLMDLQMPELDGLETTRAIRSDPSLAHLRVVALTANAFESDRRACEQAGMNDFLTKPLRPAQLEAVLLAALPQAA
ncbi:MAG: response regulator [Archangiaceae bacterium]|nr:response regulator [Archangiaceae bacterium]